MLISRNLAKPSTRNGHEFGASQQYVSIAAHFQQRQLTLLAKLFSRRLRKNACTLKFVKYPPMPRVNADFAIAAPTASFGPAEDAVAAAPAWEER